MAKARKPMILGIKSNPLSNPSEVKPIGASGDGMIDQLYKASSNSVLPLIALDPAPVAWNFFSDASDEVLEKLASSISEYGLLNPITVWEQDNGRYMILSGHTRFRAYNLLKDIFHAEYPLQDCPYDKIPCKIFRRNEINEDDARFIIILANTAQRALESKRDRIIAVCEMMRLSAAVPKKERGEKGRIGDLIAKKLGLNANTVYSYKNIGSLIPELFDLTMKGKITLHIGAKLGKLPVDIQQFIAENCLYKKIPAGEQNATHFINSLDGKTVDEVGDIFAELEPVKRIPTVKVELPFKMPRGCTAMGIVVPAKEREAVRSFLLKAARTYPDEKVRNMLLQSLSQ